MAEDRRSLRALAALLPSGILGLSMTLAAADASAATSTRGAPAGGTPESVALRLEAIRNSVSVVVTMPSVTGPSVEGEIPDRSKQRTAGAHGDARDTASASNAATICSAAATGVDAPVSMWMSGSSGGS